MKIDETECDGCGERVKSSSAEVAYWATQTLVTRSPGERSATHDLCPACAEQADPKRWPREARSRGTMDLPPQPSRSYGGDYRC